MRREDDIALKNGISINYLFRENATRSWNKYFWWKNSLERINRISRLILENRTVLTSSK